MVGISAVIVAQDEASRIGDAIRSIRPWVDEVLVVDGGSTDATVDIASAAGARVEIHSFAGFVDQKQWATDRARYDLVFSLDADERVDVELGAQIASMASSHREQPCGAWRVRRRNYLDGRPLRASGWWPDWKVRLFDRRTVRWGGREPHDRIIVERSNALCGVLHHDPERTSRTYRAASRAHAERAAQSLASTGRRPFAWTPWVRGAAHLLRKLTVGCAWLDGARGLTIAWVGAVTVLRKYRRARALLR